MRGRLFQILLLVGALLAFAPVFAVDLLLDSYIKGRETARLDAAADDFVGATRAAIVRALKSVDALIANSPTLCSPTYRDNVRDTLFANPALRQIVVASPQGSASCTALDGAFTFSPLSRSVPIPGFAATVSTVSVPGQEYPWLKISEMVRGDRQVSAFIIANPMLSYGLPASLRNAEYVTLALNDGTEIVTLGDPAGYHETRGDLPYLETEITAGDVPIRVSAAVRFGTVRLDYTDLDVGFTIVACFMSIAFLWAALTFVRRTRAPTYDLERAIRQGELQPRYQPIMNLQTGEVVGCEVLIRWFKANGQAIPPAGFIEYAEATGLAIPMTLALMERVRDELDELYGEQRDLKVGFNLFEKHFSDGAIVNDVRQIFKGSSIRYDQLVFEITERQPLSDIAGANATIAALHNLGAKIALDDAGTGHSNLAYLQTLGIDIIKIDKVFTDLITRRTDSVAVIDALIVMARDLEMEVVAEGVETAEQALYLRGRGVGEAQGFLFSPAMPVEDFIKFTRTLNEAFKKQGEPEPMVSDAA